MISFWNIKGKKSIVMLKANFACSSSFPTLKLFDASGWLRFCCAIWTFNQNRRDKSLHIEILCLQDKQLLLRQAQNKKSLRLPHKFCC